MKLWNRTLFAMALIVQSSLCLHSTAAQATLILHNGRIVTVDRDFPIQEAIAIRGNHILRIGRDEDALKTKGSSTEMLDLHGKMVLPGLFDSHVHPSSACMTECDHPIAEMETIPDVLEYIESRAEALDEGEWIIVQQVFITRLREQRYPTREELDRAAPENPVVFPTGPDASLNTLALKLSGIDEDFEVIDGGPGYVEKDPRTGEPTGILRGCTRYIKSKASGKEPTEEDCYRRLVELFKDYNSVRITVVSDRDASSPAIECYERMRKNGDLTVRLSVMQHVDTIGPLEEIKVSIRQVAENPLCKGDAMLRIIGVKTPEKRVPVPQAPPGGAGAAEHDAHPIDLSGNEESLTACQDGVVRSGDGGVVSVEFPFPRRVESLSMKIRVAGFGASACPTGNDLAVELLKHGRWCRVDAKWAFTAEYEVVALGIGQVWARAVFEGQECAGVRLVFDRKTGGEVQKAMINEPARVGRAPLRWADAPQADPKYWPWGDDLQRVLPADSAARSAAFSMIGKAPLGLPDGVGQDACVLWNGTVVLQYNYEGEKGALIVSPLFGEPFRPPGLEEAVHRRLIDGWKPGVVTQWEEDGLQYTQTAFIDFGPPPSLRVQLEIWNGSDTKIMPSVVFEVAFRPLSEFTKPLLRNRLVPVPVESESFMVDHSPERLLGPGERTCRGLNVPLTSGGRADDSFDDALEEFRGRWDRLLAKGSEVNFPDERFDNVWRACVAQLWLSLEDSVMPYGIFPSIYDGVVNGVEEGWSMLALAYAGYPQDARRILSKTYLTSEHLSKSSRHHQYRNGVTAQYAAELHRLTGDLDWLRHHKELLKEAAEWTIAQTQSTLKEAPALHAGLLPKYRYGGDLAYPAYSLYSNATCWRGLRDTAILMHALGDLDAARYEEMAKVYRKRILTAWNAIYRHDAKPPFLPFSLYDKEPRPGSGDYYQLFAPLIFETGILPRRGKEYGWVTDYLEKTGRLVAGHGRFGPVLGLDAHYMTGYLMGLLQERRRDDFLLSLYGHLALSMDQSVYSMPEVIPLFTSPAQRRKMELTRLTDWYNAPEGKPESWTLTDPCTAGPGVMIKHLRSTLVLEELDGEDLPTGNLVLFAGVPETWFRPDSSFSATGLPTFYGPVSLSCSATDKEIRIRIEAPQGKTRKLRAIEIPMPAEARVTVAGCGHAVEDFTLNLTFSGKPIEIILRL